MYRRNMPGDFCECGCGAPLGLCNEEPVSAPSPDVIEAAARRIHAQVRETQRNREDPETLRLADAIADFWVPPNAPPETRANLVDLLRHSKPETLAGCLARCLARTDKSPVVPDGEHARSLWERILDED